MPGNNDSKRKRKHPELRVVHFGKHAGKLFSEVPADYLHWVVNCAFGGQRVAQGGSEPARVRWAREELERRQKNIVKT